MVTVEMDRMTMRLPKKGDSRKSIDYWKLDLPQRCGYLHIEKGGVFLIGPLSSLAGWNIDSSSATV
jgi:hypothetical protein